MKEKYNYLESIASMLLSHGMIKKSNVISCKLSEKENLLLLEFISAQNLPQIFLNFFIKNIYFFGCM